MSDRKAARRSESGRPVNVAIIVPAAGSPGTLATTAFVGALAEGVNAAGARVTIVGLPLYVAQWRPETLGSVDTSAPWLGPAPHSRADRTEAVRRGIFDTEGDDASSPVRWQLELLLERELERFAPAHSDTLVLADTRSLLHMRCICRTARRLGWRVAVVANEALTDAQIDPATRADYIRTVARCAAGIWSFSEYLADFWASCGIDRDHIFLSPPPVRTSNFTPIQGSPEPDRAVYLGNLAHKEIDSLLEIASVLAARRPSFRLTIRGDATPEVRSRLTERIAARKLADVVAVAPAVTPSDVPGALAEASILVLPRSAGEFSTAGFPNKLGEYLASGRPVVVTAVGDIPKRLTDGENAVLVEPDDVEAFAQAVIAVLEDSERADAIGRAGKALAEKGLRSDAVARRLLAFATELPEPPSARHDSVHAGAGPAALLPDPALLRRDLRRLLGLTPQA